MRFDERSSAPGNGSLKKILDFWQAVRNCAKLIFDDLEMTTIQAYDRKQNKNDAHIDNIYVSS